jgi:hypothetical protein
MNIVQWLGRSRGRRIVVRILGKGGPRCLTEGRRRVTEYDYDESGGEG